MAGKLAHDSSQSGLVQQTDEQHSESTAYVTEMYSSAAQVVFDVHCVVVHCAFDLAWSGTAA